MNQTRGYNLCKCGNTKWITSKRCIECEKKNSLRKVSHWWRK